MAFNR